MGHVYPTKGDPKYEHKKRFHTHVIVRPFFPWCVGEFINISGLKEDVLKELIESKSVAKVEYL